jgi:tRNA threonylcarbamoyl adenosine modification protein (Sua5/YciO/YrdC/YwlC family)
MKILQILPQSIDDRAIWQVVDVIKSGGLVIYPTDSIYAIGCDALNNNAIERICAIKSMKSAKTNLSIICESISEVAHYAKLDNSQFRLLKSCLPGPYTFLLPALSKLPKAFKGRRIVGIRIPDNPIAVKIVQKLGNPIFTTSVAGIDNDYITEPELIAESYADKVDVVIDGGRGGATPTTIVDLTEKEPVIIRQGLGSF